MPNTLLDHASESNHVDLTAHIRNTSIEPIALGGFSDLYLGDLVNPHPPSKVVIKVLRAHKHGRYVISRVQKRLSQEVAILGCLSHPNITEYIGVSSHLGRPAIVMAWYALGDAPAYLKNRSVAERLRLIKGVIEGLCYMHSRTPPIVHGDIKGINVLVNDSREGVLCDFGLSRAVGGAVEPAEDTTSIVGMCGTIRWMASELVHDEPDVPPVDGPTLSSDVWAFGCTFYELILGAIPYASRRHFWLVIDDIIRGRLPFSEEDATRGVSYEMWLVLRECWKPMFKDRPSIFELKTRLSTLYN